LNLKEDSELDLELMTDDFATFFVAGQETTANTLAFCFLEIGKNPEIANKAREEIDRVLGERTEVTFQDVNDLKYCSAIFKEALRLFPPAPQVNRRVPEDIEINGITIPKDSPLWVITVNFLFFSNKI
jgi:cytochrome P450